MSKNMLKHICRDRIFKLFYQILNLSFGDYCSGAKEAVLSGQISDSSCATKSMARLKLLMV